MPSAIGPGLKIGTDYSVQGILWSPTEVAPYEVSGAIVGYL